jgi:hypothetical protein
MQVPERRADESAMSIIYQNAYSLRVLFRSITYYLCLLMVAVHDNLLQFALRVLSHDGNTYPHHHHHFYDSLVFPLQLC